jgi:small subunit ribosomal protein S17
MSEAQETRAQRGRRKVRTGTVVSDRMHKSVVVAVTRRVPHELYGKQATRTSRLVAHDERNEAHVGDVVRIVETRPLSKTKRWRVLTIVERAK